MEIAGSQTFSHFPQETHSSGLSLVVVGGRDRLHGGESPDSLQGFAAASAAVAHEGGALAHVFPHLDEVIAVGHLQDLQGLRFIDRPCVSAVLGQGARHIAEGQAGLHGGIELAGNAQMIVLVPAEAGPDPDEIRVFYDVGGPLVVQDVVGLFRHEDRFVDKTRPSLVSIRGRAP